jgi:hypothetical protein
MPRAIARLSMCSSPSKKYVFYYRARVIRGVLHTDYSPHPMCAILCPMQDQRTHKAFCSTSPPLARKKSRPPPQDAGAVLSIGPGLPPVPNKLVTRIQTREFIDMAEFLPDRLGISTTPSKDDKQATKQTRRQVTNILEWIQCFSIYVAVLTQNTQTASRTY